MVTAGSVVSDGGEETEIVTVSEPVALLSSVTVRVAV